MAMRWYVLQSFSGYENKVKLALKLLQTVHQTLLI